MYAECDDTCVRSSRAPVAGVVDGVSNEIGSVLFAVDVKHVHVCSIEELLRRFIVRSHQSTWHDVI